MKPLHARIRNKIWIDKDYEIKMILKPHARIIVNNGILVGNPLRLTWGGKNPIINVTLDNLFDEKTVQFTNLRNRTTQ